MSSGFQIATAYVDVVAVDSTGPGMASIATKMTKWASALAIGGTAASVAMAASFDRTMEMIHTQAGASQKEVDSLKASVLTLAGQVGQTPENLAKGLYHIESAGFRGAQALDMVTQAAKLATIGNANLADTAQGVVAIMASQVDGVKNATEAVQWMNAVVGSGDLTLTQLDAALGTGFLATAKTFGIGADSVMASLTTLTDNAIPADQAATKLRMAWSMMAAPVPKNIKALNALGMTQLQLADDLRKPQGMLVALEDLKKHMDDLHMTATQQADWLSRFFGGGKNSAAVLVLMTQMDRLKQKFADYGTSVQQAVSFQQAWQDTTQQLSVKFDQFKSSIEAVAIQFGQELTPAVSSVLGYLATELPVVVTQLQNFATWLSNNKEIAVALGLAIGYAISPVATLTGALVYAYAQVIPFRDLVNDVLRVVKDLATAFEHLPGAAQFFIAALVAGRLMANLFATQIAWLGSASVSTAIQLLYLKDGISNLNLAFRLGMAEAEGFTGRIKMLGVAAGETIAAGARGAVTGLKMAGSGLIDMLGGPWGIALAGATLAVGYFMDKQQKADQQVKDLTASLDAQTGALTKNSAIQIAQALQNSGVDWAKAQKDFGVSLTQATQDIIDGGPAKQDLIAKLTTIQEKSAAAARDGKRMGNSMSQNAADAWALSTRAGQLIGLLNGQSAAVNKATAQWDSNQAAVNAGTAAYKTSTSAVDALNKAISALPDKVNIQMSVSGYADVVAQILSIEQMIFAMNSATQNPGGAYGPGTAAGDAARNLNSKTNGMPQDLLALALAQFEVNTTTTTTPTPTPTPTGTGTTKATAAQKKAATAAQALAAAKDAVAKAAAGLIGVLSGSAKSITTAENTLIADLEKVKGYSSKSPLVRFLERDSAQLNALATQRDAVATKLKAAQSALDSLTKARDSLSASLASKVTDSANIVTLFGDLGGSTVVSRSSSTNPAWQTTTLGAGSGISGLIAALQAKVQAAKTFTANILFLKNKGLDPELLKQIAEAGVDAGGAVAAELVNADPSQFSVLNALEQQLQSAATDTGTTVSNSLYQPGINAAQGLVDGLKSQEAAIQAEMTKIANMMQDTLGSALQLPSTGPDWANEPPAKAGYNRVWNGHAWTYQPASKTAAPAAKPSSGPNWAAEPPAKAGYDRVWNGTAWTYQPHHTASSASSASHVTYNTIHSVTIDAKSVQDIQNVTQMMNKLQQVARAGVV